MRPTGSYPRRVPAQTRPFPSTVWPRSRSLAPTSVEGPLQESPHRASRDPRLGAAEWALAVHHVSYRGGSAGGGEDEVLSSLCNLRPRPGRPQRPRRGRVLTASGWGPPKAGQGLSPAPSGASAALPPESEGPSLPVPRPPTTSLARSSRSRWAWAPHGPGGLEPLLSPAGRVAGHGVLWELVRVPWGVGPRILRSLQGRCVCVCPWGRREDSGAAGRERGAGDRAPAWYPTLRPRRGCQAGLQHGGGDEVPRAGRGAFRRGSRSLMEDSRGRRGW